MDPINIRLLKQLIRILERIERRFSAPLHQYEHSIGSDDGSDPKHDFPRPILTVHAITELGDAESRQRKADRNSDYALQKQGLRVQRWMLLVTALAFGAAAYYAWIAKQQFVVMNDTLREAHVQNIAQQRALLAVDGFPRATSDGRLFIKYENKGRTAAKVKDLSAIYNEEIKGGEVFIPGRDDVAGSGSPVGVGASYLVMLRLPELPTVQLRANEFAEIEIILSYDDGFGNIESDHSCFTYRPIKKEWTTACGYGGEVDLTHQTDPYSTVYPPTKNFKVSKRSQQKNPKQ